MNVAVLGSGAREHALAARLARECGADRVWLCPGGALVPGSFLCADDALEAALRARDVDLVVVGPEGLLERGVVDRLRAAGFAVLGASREQTRLEASKSYAKAFMQRHGVATANSRSVRGVEAARTLAEDWLQRGGVVLKFDGLAAGKGVFVCRSQRALEPTLAGIARRFGDDAPLIVEEHLHGRELSLLALIGGGRARLFPPVEDHKQLLDGDQGPMTGGMGAAYPIPADGPALRRALEVDLVEPTLRGLRAEHPDYRGVLYLGVMLTASGPKLLEYNVRFGDPEAQVLAFAMGESLAQLCAATARGEVTSGWIEMAAPACVAVVLAAPGYPEDPRLDLPVVLGPLPADVEVYHAAIRQSPEGWRSAGGRVLSVVGRAPTLPLARERVYAPLSSQDALHYRRDIGARP